MLNNHHERGAIFSNDNERKGRRKVGKSPFFSGNDIAIWKPDFRLEKGSQEIWQHLHWEGKIEEDLTLRNGRNE